MSRSKVLLLAILAVACPRPATAEEPYETVVHGHAADERRPADDPAGSSTVLRVTDPPAGTELPELIDRVPGLRVRDSGPGGLKALSLRGADSQQALVLLDGVELSSVSGGGVDLSLLDPAHLARIEVRRGGSSARFGSSALGGMVSLSTPRLRTRRRSSASLGYGSFNQVAMRGSHAGAAWRRWRYLVSGSYRQGDGDFPYVHHINRTQHVRDNNAYRRGELLLKTDLLLSDRWQIGALDDLALGERGAPGVLDSPCTTASQQDLRNLAALRATRYDLLLDGSKLDLSLSHRVGRFRFSDPCAFNQPSFTEGHAANLASRLALPLGDTGRLDAGIELREELLLDRMSVVEQATIPDGQVDRVSAGLWVSSSTRLLDRLLVITPAVRLALASGFGATIVPKAGVVFRPLGWTGSRYLQGLALVGNVGRSFRHPSLHELYVDMDSLRGNAELQPEDALDGDVGLRWEQPKVAVELTYFRRLIKNLILYAPVSPYLVEAGNYPSVETEGAEGTLRLTPGVGLDLRAAYTFTRTRWDEPALSLPGHPEHRLVARLAWTYPWRGGKPRWRVRLWSGATYESGMPLDRANSIEVGQRVLLSAGGSFNYRWLTLGARGDNLLDRRDLLDSLGFPLPPARFLVSLSGAL